MHTCQTLPELKGNQDMYACHAFSMSSGIASGIFQYCELPNVASSVCCPFSSSLLLCMSSAASASLLCSPDCTEALLPPNSFVAPLHSFLLPLPNIAHIGPSPKGVSLLFGRLLEGDEPFEGLCPLPSKPPLEKLLSFELCLLPVAVCGRWFSSACGS